MTWWQFTEAVDGYVAANSDPSKDGLSDIETEQLWALAQLPDA
ncbi:hypothetical protein [Camelimonas lactis]|nr:hypothetical protein [Camelimonas lactis]